MTPDPTPQPGERRRFYIIDHDTNQARTITARLLYTGEYAYFWAEEGIPVDPQDVASLMQTFEQRIYPAMRRYFGTEPSPGIDGDPRIYILYVASLGGNVAGYFSSNDAWPRSVHPYSNQHEMFVFAANAVSLNHPWVYSLLAHEFQHMIHWSQDRNEASWINEGASELAPHLLRLQEDSRAPLYLLNPAIPLNAWPDPQESSTLPHYAASFLFLTYFWERLGDQALRDLIAEPANGWDGVQAVLDRYAPGMTYEDLFLDWLVAITVNDPKAADGRFGFRTLNLPVTARADYLGCAEDRAEDVAPFGLDLYEVLCPQPLRLRISTSSTVPLLPIQARSGRWMFWSNYGDESEMTLTRRFDLTQVQGQAALQYWTWFDLEQDYDYVYVLASRDGERWEMLRPPAGQEANPTGNNYGWGYTGPSGGADGPRWIQETLDLSAYTGGPVWVRFVYVTDAAVNRRGFVLDDVRLDAIGYATDFERDAGGWQAQGFVRVTSVLPNALRVRIVRQRGEDLTVRTYALGAERPAMEVSLAPQEGERLWVLVTQVARYTRERVSYRLQTEP